MSFITAAVVTISAAGIGAKVQSDAEKRASKKERKASEKAQGVQVAAKDEFIERTQPFVEPGLQAAGQITDFLNQPQADPLAGLDQINPVASFLQQQGFRTIRESGAGGGRNVDQDLSEFQTGLTSTLVPQFQQLEQNKQQQRFNQLFNVLGLGSNVSQNQGQAGLSTAANISNLITNQGASAAKSDRTQGQIATEFISNVAGSLGAINPSQSPQIPTGTSNFGPGFIPTQGSQSLGGPNFLGNPVLQQSAAQQPNLLSVF